MQKGEKSYIIPIQGLSVGISVQTKRQRKYWKHASFGYQFSMTPGSLLMLVTVVKKVRTCLNRVR